MNRLHDTTFDMQAVAQFIVKFLLFVRYIQGTEKDLDILYSESWY
jgi:hypothetical protein